MHSNMSSNYIKLDYKFFNLKLFGENYELLGDLSITKLCMDLVNPCGDECFLCRQMSSGTPCLVDMAKSQKAFMHGAMGVERHFDGNHALDCKKDCLKCFASQSYENMIKMV